jgi:hypothetical protein
MQEGAASRWPFSFGAERNVERFQGAAVWLSQLPAASAVSHWSSVATGGPVPSNEPLGIGPLFRPLFILRSRGAFDRRPLGRETPLARDRDGDKPELVA